MRHFAWGYCYSGLNSEEDGIRHCGLAEQGLPLCYYLCGGFILAGSNAGVQCGFPQVL